MSAPHDHAAHAGHGHDAGHGHGTRRDYLVGFLLSVVLTAVPFGLVMTGLLSAPVTAVAVILFAFAQIVVHTIFFLHVNPKAEGGWTLMTLVFTGVVVTLVIAGSLWIMYHLNSNMMPMQPGSMPGM